MTDEERVQGLVAYRLEQADDALLAARTLREAGLARDSVNRSYYAMFYAVLAALATRGVGSSKHAGALGLFDTEFVRPGLLPRELSQWLHRVFERRLEADYRESSTVDEGEAEECVERATAFIARVRALVGQP